jgi:hypothetical protein
MQRLCDAGTPGVMRLLWGAHHKVVDGCAMRHVRPLWVRIGHVEIARGWAMAASAIAQASAANAK